MTNASYFIDSNKFQKTLALISHEIDKSHEEFIVHFKQTYSDPYPPAWILAEILPLGVMTNIFINLKDSQVKRNSPAFWFATSSIRFLDDDYYRNEKCLLSSCSCLEQAEYSDTDEST